MDVLEPFYYKILHANLTPSNWCLPLSKFSLCPVQTLKKANEVVQLNEDKRAKWLWDYLGQNDSFTSADCRL